MQSASGKRLFSLARWALGLTFLWAGLSKVLDLHGFAASIEAYQLPLLTPGTAWLAALSLPWVELGCGVLLLIERWTGFALRCTFSLLVLFILVTGQAWLRGLPIACGCFDLSIFGLDDPYSNLTKFFNSVEFAFWRAVALAAFAGSLLIWHRQPSNLGK